MFDRTTSVNTNLIGGLFFLELFFQCGDSRVQSALLVEQDRTLVRVVVQLLLQLITLGLCHTASSLATRQVLGQLHHIGFQALNLAFDLLRSSGKLVSRGSGLLRLPGGVFDLNLQFLELFEGVFFDFVVHLELLLHILVIGLDLLALGYGCGSLLPFIFQFSFQISELFDESAALLFGLLFLSLELALELGSHGLHVDLEPKFGVLGTLQFIFELLNLGLLFGDLGLEQTLGLLELVHVLVGSTLIVDELVELGLQALASAL